MIEIIYRVRFPESGSSKFRQVFVHETGGKYEVIEGVYESYCDHFESPQIDYDFNTAKTFDNALEADDYARKRFLTIQGETVLNEEVK